MFTLLILLVSLFGGHNVQSQNDDPAPACVIQETGTNSCQ
jgi:hypothetical protein